MRFSINIFISLFILVLISACNSGGSSSSSDPGISNFSATSTTIAVGSSVNLTVEFVGGTGVINNGIGEVTSGAAISVSPATTTTYNLTVTNSAGSIAVTSFVTVTVVAGIIESFSTASSTIIVGDSIDLTAVFITDGTGSIDNGISEVTSNTPVSVTPSETTSYTLTLTNSLGDTVSSTITVTVVALDLLSISNEDLDQIFQTGQFAYTASVGFLAKSIQIEATSADAGASITVNGAAIGADNLSQLIALAEDADTVINIAVRQNTVSKTYTLTVSRASAAAFAEQAYIKASNTGGSDEFGYRVALSGDTLAVGAYLEDSSSNTTPDENATDSGAVYVFTRSGSTWTQQAYIKASNIGAGDKFGISVALSGDTLAVGAPGEDSITQGVGTVPDDLDPDANSGAVYIFARAGSNWSEEAYIKASNTGDQDEFGNSVALFDNTLAVGAHNEDSGTTGIGSTEDNTAANSGAVYIFTRNGASWSEQAYIKASNTEALDTFGDSVALFGDTLAVGSPKEDSITTGINSTPVDNKITDDYGAVYVFVRNNTSWSQQAYIKASETDKADLFGISIALSADTLAVGMYQEDSETTGINTTPIDTPAGKNTGAVYVFARSGTNWSKQAYIKASTTRVNDLFGYNVALSGDTLAVGVYGEDSDTTGINSTPNTNSSLAGAAYVFTRSAATWSEQYYIKASNTSGGDRFGWSTALSGDTLAVGAHFEDSSNTDINSTPDNNLATDAGAVYTFE